MGTLPEVIAIPLGVIHNAVEYAKRGRQLGGRFGKVVAVSH